MRVWIVGVMVSPARHPYYGLSFRCCSHPDSSHFMPEKQAYFLLFAVPNRTKTQSRGRQPVMVTVGSAASQSGVTVFVG